MLLQTLALGYPEPRSNTEVVVLSDSEAHGGTLVRVGLFRLATLVVSGVPTLGAWALLSHRTATSTFAGIALATALPTIVALLTRSLGLGVTFAVVRGQQAVERSVRGAMRNSALVCALLICGVTALYLFPTWERVLGYSSESFSLNKAVLASSLLVALWIMTLPATRSLIAHGRVTASLAGQAVSGPIALLGIVTLTAAEVPTWTYVIPLSAGNAVGGLIACTLSRRELRWSKVLWERQSEDYTPRPTGRGVALVAQEGSIASVLWLARPLLQITSGEAAVASFALGWQFVAPLQSLADALGQTLWRRYASAAASSRDLPKDLLTFGGLGALMGCAFIAATVVADHVGFVRAHFRFEELLLWAIYLGISALLQPLKIAAVTRGGIAPQIAAGISGALLAIGSGALLSLGYGARGVLLGMCMGALLTALMLMKLLRRTR